MPTYLASFTPRSENTWEITFWASVSLWGNYGHDVGLLPRLRIMWKRMGATSALERAGRWSLSYSYYEVVNCTHGDQTSHAASREGMKKQVLELIMKHYRDQSLNPSHPSFYSNPPGSAFSPTRAVKLHDKPQTKVHISRNSLPSQ